MLRLITGFLCSIVFLDATDLETEKRKHENFWNNIEGMIRDDVTTGMARIMSSGRADAVIARAATNGAL